MRRVSLFPIMDMDRSRADASPASFLPTEISSQFDSYLSGATSNISTRAVAHSIGCYKFLRCDQVSTNPIVSWSKGLSHIFQKTTTSDRLNSANRLVPRRVFERESQLAWPYGLEQRAAGDSTLPANCARLHVMLWDLSLV